MQNEVSLGMNRTGAQMARAGTKEILAYANERLDEVPPDSSDDVEMRIVYADEADPMGSVPMPGTMKGALNTAVGALKGDKPTVFIDKLGERLAFERTGVRLYEAMITKCLASGTPFSGSLTADAAPGTTGSLLVTGPIDIAALQSIRDEEASHMHLVIEAMESVGADPTAMTPCADVSGLLAIGPLQTLTDPRTTLAQCLQALLTIELADNASWELLTELAGVMGHEDLAMQFSVAQQAEERHVERVRGWLRSMVLEEAT